MEKMTKVYVALATATLFVLGTAGMASAQSFVDPTGGGAGQVQSDTLGWISSDGSPLIVGLLVAGLIIGLLVKFARKGKQAA